MNIETKKIQRELFRVQADVSAQWKATGRELREVVSGETICIGRARQIQWLNKKRVKQAQALRFLADAQSELSDIERHEAS